MDTEEQARQIARVIQEALPSDAALLPAGARHHREADERTETQRNFGVTKQGGCVACDPGFCSECGFLFTGEAIVIHHKTRGKRVLSDRGVHYLSHGTVRYSTGYVVRGEPVVVDLDLNELAGYLDL